MFCHLIYSFSDETSKPRIFHKSCNSREIGDKIQSFVTKRFFFNVAQYFSYTRIFSDQTHFLSPETYSDAILVTIHVVTKFGH